MNQLIEEYKKAVVKKYSDRVSALGDASPTYEDGIRAGINEGLKLVEYTLMEEIKKHAPADFHNHCIHVLEWKMKELIK